MTFLKSRKDSTDINNLDANSTQVTQISIDRLKESNLLISQRPPSPPPKIKNKNKNKNKKINEQIKNSIEIHHSRVRFEEMNSSLEHTEFKSLSQNSYAKDWLAFYMFQLGREET